MIATSRTPIRFSAAAVVCLAFIGLAACSSAGGGGSATGGGPNLLTAEDLADVQQLDAHQAIQRLRPRWLRGRGGVNPSVIVDGAGRPEGLAALEAIRVGEVEEMRFMNANDATLRYGTGHNGGAILITTKR